MTPRRLSFRIHYQSKSLGICVIELGPDLQKILGEILSLS